MRTFLILLAFLITQPSTAAIYRWVDADGQTVYSQTPPPDAQAERMRAPREPEVDAADRKQPDQRQQEMDDYLEDRQLKAEKRKKAREAQKLAQENCGKARQNYKNLEESARPLVAGPDGEYRILAEDERQQRMDDARVHIEKFCK